MEIRERGPSQILMRAAKYKPPANASFAAEALNSSHVLYLHCVTRATTTAFHFGSLTASEELGRVCFLIVTVCRQKQSGRLQPDVAVL